MKEHGLLFTDAMVRAYLAGRKTQTRRPLRLPRRWGDQIEHQDIEASGFWCVEPGLPARHWQYGDDRLPQQCHVGDRLWVRECWAPVTDYDGQFLLDGRTALYRADQETNITPSRWRPSIHMPRWAARLVLPVTSVRHERVQDITEQDARAEGVEPLPRLENYWDDLEAPRQYSTCREAFMSLWRNLYGMKYPPETAWCVVIETETFT